MVGGYAVGKNGWMIRDEERKSKTPGWSHTYTHMHTQANTGGPRYVNTSSVQQWCAEEHLQTNNSPGLDWLSRQQEINAGFQLRIWRGYISHMSINTFKVMSRKTPPGPSTTVNIAMIAGSEWMNLYIYYLSQAVTGSGYQAVVLVNVILQTWKTKKSTTERT